MKKISFFISVFIIAIASSAQFKTPRSNEPLPDKKQVGAAAMPDQIAPITAPFNMPRIEKPKFPDYKLNINKFGAKPGKRLLNTFKRQLIHGKHSNS